MNPNLSIKQWAIEDRPREKLLNKGIYSLSDTELLAILIATGTKKYSAVDLAKMVLNSANNNLHLLGKKTLHDLIKINGIGEAKAITILASLELGRRRKNSDSEQIKIETSQHIAEIFQPILGDLSHEEFWTIYLNRANNIIHKERISTGGTTGTVIDTKMILKQGIERLACGIILVHNHPSGNTKPSTNDIEITRKIKSAAQLVDISLLDHIIIADKTYFSFTDEGKL